VIPQPEGQNKEILMLANKVPRRMTDLEEADIQEVLVYHAAELTGEEVGAVSAQ
jgi:hypothetical protein